MALYGISIFILFLVFYFGGLLFLRHLNNLLFSTKYSLSTIKIDQIRDNPYMFAFV